MARYIALPSMGILRLDLDGVAEEGGETFFDTVTGQTVTFQDGFDLSISGTIEIIIQENVTVNGISSAGSTLTFTAEDGGGGLGEVPEFDSRLSPITSGSVITFAAGSNVTVGSATFDSIVNFFTTTLTGFFTFNGTIGPASTIFADNARMIFNTTNSGDIVYNTTLATDYVLFAGQTTGNITNNGPNQLDVFFNQGSIAGGGGTLNYGGLGGMNILMGGFISGNIQLGDGADIWTLSSSHQQLNNTAFTVNLGGGTDTINLGAVTMASQLTFDADAGDDIANIGGVGTILGTINMGSGADTVNINGQIGTGSSQRAQVNLGTSELGTDTVIIGPGSQSFADITFGGDASIEITGANHVGNITALSGTADLVVSNSFVSTIDATGIFLGANDDTASLSNATVANLDTGGGADQVDVENFQGSIEMGAGADTIRIGDGGIFNVAGGADIDTFIFDGTSADATITDWEDGEDIILENLLTVGSHIRIIVDGEFFGGVSLENALDGNGNRQVIEMNVTNFTESVEIVFSSPTAYFSLGPSFVTTSLTIEGDIDSFDASAFTFV